MNMPMKELMKLVESGQLAASEFLPKFSDALRVAARAGGALEAGLNTSRKAMQRFGVAFELNVLDMFEAGAEEGLATFFNDMSGLIEDTGPMWRLLGSTVGGVVSTISTAFRVLGQLIRPVVMLAEDLFEVLFPKDAMQEMNKILGILLLPFALIEQALDDLEKRNIFKVIGSFAKDILPTSFQATSTTPTVSGNTTNSANITINANDAEHVGTIVKRNLDEMMYAEFSTSMATGG